MKLLSTVATASKPLLAACALGLFSAQAQSPLDIRIALVIGNSAYTHVPKLDNAGKDARSVAEALRGLGFTVEEVNDADKARMAQAIDRVRQSLHGKQALGMLYYAGHGVQVDWRNYMLPVDVRLANAADVQQQAVDIGSVVDTFRKAGTRMNILVLDACRDNPFALSGSVSGKGLAPMDAPPGTFLAYATQPGNVAEDGDPAAANGPYAQYLTLELRKPFARVEDVFKRVRYQVRKQTGGRQIPWESTSLEEDFVFNDGSRMIVKSADLERLASEARSREQSLLQQAQQARERERQLALELERERERQAAAAREAERLRVIEEARQKEAERLAALERQKEQDRQTAEARAREAERAAAEARRRDEERLAIEARRREEERVSAEERRRDEERLAREAQVRERERLMAEAKRRDEERQARDAQARERERVLAQQQTTEEQRRVALAQQQERERVQRMADERERERAAESQRLAADAKRREQEAAARQAQALERERVLAAEAARERERQRALEQALQLARDLEAQRQREVEQLASEMRAREALQRLSQAQRREVQFAEQKAEWDRIRDTKSAGDVYAFVLKYPNGAVTELAQAKLEQLDKPRIQPVADQSGQVQPFEARRFRLGDSYEFVVRDLLTKLEVERPSFRVVAADAETAEFNQGYKVTQAGAIIRTIAGASLDPYQQWIPSGEYQVGKRWYTRSIISPRGGASQWVELHGRVVARESVTVPAGTFDTYKMEMEQVAQDGTRLKITYWGQPDWGVAIKQIREIRDTRGALSGQVYEMVSRRRGN